MMRPSKLSIPEDREKGAERDSAMRHPLLVKPS